MGDAVTQAVDSVDRCNEVSDRAVQVGERVRDCVLPQIFAAWIAVRQEKAPGAERELCEQITMSCCSGVVAQSTVRACPGAIQLGLADKTA